MREENQYRRENVFNQIVNVLENGKTVQYVYNNRGLLEREVFDDGVYRKYSYTPSGRLDTVTDSNNNIFRRNNFQKRNFQDVKK
jgi:YD repeat-containing protein